MTRRKTTPKTPTPPNPDSETPDVTVVRRATCSSLEGGSKLSYHVGSDDAGSVYVRIATNSGGGFFSDEWVSFNAIQATLSGWPKDAPITSMALRVDLHLKLTQDLHLILTHPGRQIMA